jgi:hypothetical protein
VYLGDVEQQDRPVQAVLMGIEVLVEAAHPGAAEFQRLGHPALAQSHQRQTIHDEDAEEVPLGLRHVCFRDEAESSLEIVLGPCQVRSREEPRVQHCQEVVAPRQVGRVGKALGCPLQCGASGLGPAEREPARVRCRLHVILAETSEAVSVKRCAHGPF